MAHKRKDTLVAPAEWDKHLRPFHKRVIAKRERRAAQQMIKNEAQTTKSGTEKG